MQLQDAQPCHLDRSGPAFSCVRCLRAGPRSGETSLRSLTPVPGSVKFHARFSHFPTNHYFFFAAFLSPESFDSFVSFVSFGAPSCAPASFFSLFSPSLFSAPAESFAGLFPA